MKRGTLQSGSAQAPAIRTPSAPSRQGAISVRGASGDPARGAYCTPKYVAASLPAFDLDPFTNSRSHIRSTYACVGDHGDDGFGDGNPGTFTIRGVTRQATSSWRVFKQPDYTQVLACVRHYLHTRFVALLRFDPRPEWADLIGGASEWIGVLSNSPDRSSFEFEPAPGVVASSNTFPHALYARHYADVTPAMRALCSYPDGTARHFRKRSAISPDWLTRWGLTPELFAQPTATFATKDAP